jgi:hypothetical protein
MGYACRVRSTWIARTKDRFYLEQKCGMAIAMPIILLAMKHSCMTRDMIRAGRPQLVAFKIGRSKALP